MNFILKKNLRKNNHLIDEESQLNQWFLIFTQSGCNSVTIGNVDTGKFLRKVELADVKHISNCIIWNEGSSKIHEVDSIPYITYLILSCDQETYHSIKVLDFDTLNILFVKNILDHFILQKIHLKSEQENGKNPYNEGLAFIIRDGEKRIEIGIYENDIKVNPPDN